MLQKRLTTQARTARRQCRTLPLPCAPRDWEELTADRALGIAAPIRQWDPARSSFGPRHAGVALEEDLALTLGLLFWMLARIEEQGRDVCRGRRRRGNGTRGSRLLAGDGDASSASPPRALGAASAAGRAGGGMERQEGMERQDRGLCIDCPLHLIRLPSGDIGCIPEPLPESGPEPRRECLVVGASDQSKCGFPLNRGRSAGHPAVG